MSSNKLDLKLENYKNTLYIVDLIRFIRLNKSLQEWELRLLVLAGEATLSEVFGSVQAVVEDGV